MEKKSRIWKFFGSRNMNCVNQNTNPSIKNKTTKKKISSELDKFAHRFWYYSEKSSEEQWGNGIKNQHKNQLQIEIQKRTNRL